MHTTPTRTIPLELTVDLIASLKRQATRYGYSLDEWVIMLVRHGELGVVQFLSRNNLLKGGEPQ